MKITITSRTQYQIVITDNTLVPGKKYYTPQYKNSRLDPWHSFPGANKAITSMRYESMDAATNRIHTAAKPYIAVSEVIIDTNDRTQQ